YKETITKKGDAQHRHKKQSGGSGQFGEVFLRIEPLPDDDFEFVNEVVGGSVSQNYMTAIEKGIKSVMQTGVVAGFPVHNVRAAVYDGKEHPVDSKPVAFEIAGREAFKKAIMTAGPVLLEPIMNVRITVPEDNMGDVLGDLNTRRARVQGMDTDRGRSVVNAHVPLAELLSYTTELRSMTGGRGVFTMEEDHYERVPTHLQADIVAAKEKVEEEE
ncbi:MAG: elongation factor G, partial [Chloroflexi bacterium]|nr:elongation factor G [Chloroflexota bacterium]